MMSLCVLEFKNHRFENANVYKDGWVRQTGALSNPDLILLMVSPETYDSSNGFVSISSVRSKYLKQEQEKGTPILVAIPNNDGSLHRVAHVNEILNDNLSTWNPREISIEYAVNLFAKHYQDTESIPNTDMLKDADMIVHNNDNYLKGGIVRPIEDNDLIIRVGKVNPLKRILPQVKQSK